MKKDSSIIIAGFPGVGKSYLHSIYGDNQISDSDSSKFPKEDFPNNYIKHIKSLIGKKKIILVSTHKEVLKGLEEENIDYILVYPRSECKDEYLQRYKNRKSPQEFINLLDKKWDSFIEDLKNSNPTKRIILNPGEFIKDRIKQKSQRNAKV